MSSIGASLHGSHRNAESGKGEDLPTNLFLSFLPFLPFLYFFSTYSALQ